MRGVPPPGVQRRLALMLLIDRCGTGVYFTLSALYFTRIVGLTPLQVGTGLSIAAAAGLLAGVPMGHLADRRGARKLLITAQVLTGVCSALLLLVHNYPEFVVVASLNNFCHFTAITARNGLVGRVVVGEERIAFRAYLRSITNVGMTVGMALAAIALHFDTKVAYQSVMWFNVATFAVVVVLARALPEPPVLAAQHGAGMMSVFRDRPAVVLMLFMSVLTMHYSLLEIALPLWVVDHTTAPRWLVSALLVLNTLVVVVGQVAVARRVSTVGGAVRASVLSGVLLLIGCGVMGATGGVGVGLAVGLLMLGCLFQVGAELLQATGGFVLSYELAPEEALSAYQGLYGMSYSIAGILAPTLIALLPLRMGAPGWWAMGALMCAAAFAMPFAVRRVQTSHAGRVHPEDSLSPAG